jgi:hypothetical protein
MVTNVKKMAKIPISRAENINTKLQN